MVTISRRDVFAEMIAVVVEKDDDCIVCQPTLVEHIADFADGAFDTGDLFIILTAEEIFPSF